EHDKKATCRTQQRLSGIGPARSDAKGVVHDNGAPLLQQRPQSSHGEAARLLPLLIGHSLATMQSTVTVDCIETDELNPQPARHDGKSTPGIDHLRTRGGPALLEDSSGALRCSPRGLR